MIDSLLIVSLTLVHLFAISMFEFSSYTYSFGFLPIRVNKCEFHIMAINLLSLEDTPEVETKDEDRGESKS